MSHPPARLDVHCRNCGVPAPLSFCPACGQETALHPPTLTEFLHEFVGHYVALEGALWRTLKLLLLRPGQLTREYLEGRRRRYVLPLRLYLTASFVLFLMLKLMPHALPRPPVAVGRGPAVVISDTVPAVAASGAGAGAGGRRGAGAVSGAASAASAGDTARARIEPPAGLRPVDCGGAGERPCGLSARIANRIGQRFKGDPAALVDDLRARLVGVAPYAVFLLMPVFAGIVSAAYRRRGMTYGEHVVFSLHLHAAWFAVLLLVLLLPQALAGPVLWLVPLYAVLAMRRVYQGGWGPTLARAVAVAMAYGVVLVLATTALTLGLLILV